MSRLAKLLHIIDVVSIRTGRGVSWINLILMGTIGYEVVARYAFNAPTVWSMELGTYMFAAVWLFAGAWTHQSKAHVTVDVVYSRFSKRRKAIVDVCTAPFILIMMGVVIWQLLDYGLLSLEIKEHSPSQWGPPVWIMKMVMPVGVFMLTVQCLARIVRDWYTAITGKDLK